MGWGRGHVSGVLAEHADGFRAQLLAVGYTEASAARLVHLMAHLSRWLRSKKPRSTSAPKHKDW